MSTSHSAPERNARFGRAIERRDQRDFPFYNADPLELATWKWLVIIAACVSGFIILSVIPTENEIVSLAPRVLFVIVPLLVFIAFTGRRWIALFHGLRWGDIGAMIIYWLITLTVSVVIDLLSKSIFGSSANPATNGVTTEGPGGIAAFYVGTAIQIFGEEVFTFLPFLAVMYWMYAKAGTSRRVAVIVAWLVTALWFGAAHLPTYDWNVFQALFVIGVGRLVLSLAYIRTKNILVSTGAHILDDFSLFTVALVFS